MREGAPGARTGRAGCDTVNFMDSNDTMSPAEREARRRTVMPEDWTPDLQERVERAGLKIGRYYSSPSK